MIDAIRQLTRYRGRKRSFDKQNYLQIAKGVDPYKPARPAQDDPD